MKRTLILLPVLALFFGCEGGGGDGGPPVMLIDGGSAVLVDGSAVLIDGASPAPVDGPDAGPVTVAPASISVGASCNCDSECEGSDTHPGLCVQGICMNRASAECGSSGSTDECPAGSRCWSLEGYTASICWPDCDAVSCDGMCDSDGSCVAAESSTCTASCSQICSESTGGDGSCPDNSHRSTSSDGCVCDEAFVVNADMNACVRECQTDPECGDDRICVDNTCRMAPCTATSCPSGSICGAAGACILDLGTPPPGSPPASCTIGSSGIPEWRCTSDCGTLVAFDPRITAGYEDYPLNGETSSDQYRSFVRRDVMMLVQYSAAMVECQARAWTLGNGGPLGLGDMSEANGAIPGTREEDPGHPAGTHVNGHDMDIGYYQTGTADNRLRSICEHEDAAGVEQYHCTSDPVLLDPWRTALFIGHLHANTNLRVIGVDGRAGVAIDSALTQLCADGWVPSDSSACTRHSITYETTDMGRGWYRFHHHHLHISVSAP